MLTLEEIHSTPSDWALFKLLAAETLRLLPNELLSIPDLFAETLHSVPPGIRAVSGIYDLDVSMSMDDLAWHFGNHDTEHHIQETLWSLNELEAPEVHSIFTQAVSIVRPHLEVIRSGTLKTDNFHNWLNETGIQGACDPLNQRLWAIRADYELGLLQLPVNHARKHPERFIHFEQ